MNILQLFSMFLYQMSVTSFESLQCYVQGLLGWQSRRLEPSLIWARTESPYCPEPKTTPHPKFPELSEEALLIRKWYLWIYVDLSRNVNETSNLKFLSDWRPIGGLWRPLELTGQATLSLGWCGDHHLIWALAGQHPFRPLSYKLGSSFKVTYFRFPFVL